MIKMIKEFIKQEFDIKNKPNTTYRNYMFVVFFLTFTAIAINSNDQVIIFYSFIGISLLCVVFYLIFHDDKPKKKEKQNTTYEVQSPYVEDKLENALGEIAGCFSIGLTIIITICMVIMLYSSVGLGMFILIMLVGGGVVIPIIYGISDIISRILTPILLFIIVALLIYYITH